MSKRDARGNPKTLQERLGHFAFMRRARERTQKEDAVKERAFKDSEEHWTSSRASVGGCTVIVEADPGPGISTGRMSFQNFNPKTEKLQREIENQDKTLKWIREYGEQCRRGMESGAEISDLEMAKMLRGVDLNPSEESKREVHSTRVVGKVPEETEEKVKLREKGVERGGWSQGLRSRAPKKPRIDPPERRSAQKARNQKFKERHGHRKNRSGDRHSAGGERRRR